MPWTAGLAVRVFTHERAHVGRRRVVEALMALAQRQGLAGVTVTRALAEAPPPAAHASLAPYTSQASQSKASGEGAPLIVEMVDRRERVEAALPDIAALVPRGALTVTETRVFLPASRMRASDAREQPEQTLPPDAPATEALHALLTRGVRLIPILDAERKPLGVLTINHLLRQIKDELNDGALNLSNPEQVRGQLLAQLDGKRVRELMRAPALSVHDDAPLDSVARYLISHAITRAIVVDAHGRCVGLVSEHALVRLLTHPLLADAAQLPATQAEAQAEARAALAGSIEPAGGEPLTAARCADRAIPHLGEAATWDELTRAVEASGMALVVDAQGRLRGVIEEGALLERTTNAAPEGNLATLRRLLADVTGQREAMTPERTRDLHAGALSQPPRLIEAPATPLALALAHMVAAGAVDYAVIAAPDAPPIGVLWRQDALRALVGG